MTLSPTPKPGYMRPDEAAVYLSVSMTSIYRLMKSKELKSYLVGGSRILKISDIDALVEASDGSRRRPNWRTTNENTPQ
jgi:excisionase family DNA binding protein